MKNRFHDGFLILPNKKHLVCPVTIYRYLSINVSCYPPHSSSLRVNNFLLLPVFLFSKYVVSNNPRAYHL